MSTRFVTFLLLAAASAGTPALAAPPPGPHTAALPAAPAKPKDRADDLFDQGTAAVDAGHMAEAESKFQEAWTLKQTHDIAGNLGIVQRHLGKYREAVERLTWALDHWPPTESSAARKALEQELRLARAEVGALRVRVNVDGADVTVNGHAAGPSPIDGEVLVDPGTARVTARREGYVTAVQAVTVQKGEAREVSVTLAPVKPKGRSAIPAVVFGSVGGAALVGGVALIGLAESKRSEMASLTVATQHMCVAGAPSPQGNCATLASVASNADRLGDLGVGGLVVAGVAAAGLATYLLWPVPRREAGAVQVVRVVPVVGAGSGGVFVTGSF
jgi:hypothetical protein